MRVCRTQDGCNRVGGADALQWAWSFLCFRHVVGLPVCCCEFLVFQVGGIVFLLTLDHYVGRKTGNLPLGGSLSVSAWVFDGSLWPPISHKAPNYSLKGGSMVQL